MSSSLSYYFTFKFYAPNYFSEPESSGANRNSQMTVIQMLQHPIMKHPPFLRPICNARVCLPSPEQSKHTAIIDNWRYLNCNIVSNNLIFIVPVHPNQPAASQEGKEISCLIPPLWRKKNQPTYVKPTDALWRKRFFLN